MLPLEVRKKYNKWKFTEAPRWAKYLVITGPSTYFFASKLSTAESYLSKMGGVLTKLKEIDGEHVATTIPKAQLVANALLGEGGFTKNVLIKRM